MFSKSTEWCSIKQTLIFSTSQPFPNWFFSFFNRFVIVNLLAELKAAPGFVILTLGVISLYLVRQVPTLVLFSVGIVFSINQSWKIHVQGKTLVNHSEKNVIIFKQRGDLSVLWNSLERAAFNKETFYLLFAIHKILQLFPFKIDLFQFSCFKTTIKWNSMNVDSNNLKFVKAQPGPCMSDKKCVS